MTRVVDDFLSPEHFNRIQQTMMGASFPWYYNQAINHMASLDGHDFQFTHAFYRDHQWTSDFANLMFPLVERLNPTAILRIKANLGSIDSEHRQGGWHKDYDIKCRTAVFYVNTNNGWTEFVDGSKVESVANRYAEFDSLTEHTGVSQTDESVRVLININFIS